METNKPSKETMDLVNAISNTLPVSGQHFMGDYDRWKSHIGALIDEWKEQQDAKSSSN